MYPIAHSLTRLFFCFPKPCTFQTFKLSCFVLLIIFLTFLFASWSLQMIWLQILFPIFHTLFLQVLLATTWKVKLLTLHNIQLKTILFYKFFWRKQCVAWKPHNYNSVIWVIYHVKNNQPIDFTQNQIMCCIVCHYQIVGLEILALCTKNQKGLIAYHKSNGITVMKIHIEVEHNNLLKRHVEE